METDKPEINEEEEKNNDDQQNADQDDKEDSTQDSTNDMNDEMEDLTTVVKSEIKEKPGDSEEKETEKEEVKKSPSEVINEQDEMITLDLSKSLPNGSQTKIRTKERQPLSENYVNTPMTRSQKRARSNDNPITTNISTSIVEDLSISGTKRQHNNILPYSNGDANSIDNDDVDDNNDDKSNHNNNNNDNPIMLKRKKRNNNDIYDMLNIQNEQQQQTENENINDNDVHEESIAKIKLIRCLKQRLFNEEMKLLFLKKIRQSQLKENISQQQQQQDSTTMLTNSNQQHGHGNHQQQQQNHSNRIQQQQQQQQLLSHNLTNSSASAAAAAAFANNLSSFSGLNLTSLQREFAQHLLAQQQQQNHSSTSTTSPYSAAGFNSLLNFSMPTSGSGGGSHVHHKNMANLINNNVAHSNHHSPSVNTGMHHTPAHIGNNTKNYHSSNSAVAAAAAAAAALNFSTNHHHQQQPQPMQAHMSKSSSGSHHGSSSSVKTPSPAHLNNPTYHHGITAGRSPYNYNPLAAPPPPPPVLTKHRNSSNSSSIGHPDSPHANLNAAHTSSMKSTSSSNNRAISSSSPNLTYQDLRHSSSSKHNQVFHYFHINRCNSHYLIFIDYTTKCTITGKQSSGS